jgi:hypothetical protein
VPSVSKSFDSDFFGRVLNHTAINTTIPTAARIK